MKIYIARRGQKYGPYTLEDLHRYLAEGSITVDDHAWREGLAEWVKLQVLLGERPSEPRLVGRAPEQTGSDNEPAKSDDRNAVENREAIGVTANSEQSAAPREVGEEALGPTTAVASSSLPSTTELGSRDHDLGSPAAETPRGVGDAAIDGADSGGQPFAPFSSASSEVGEEAPEPTTTVEPLSIAPGGPDQDLKLSQDPNLGGPASGVSRDEVHRRPRRKFSNPAVVGSFVLLPFIVGLVALFSQLLSPHVSLGRDLRPHPEAGYVWVSPGSHLDWRVVWSPGTPHPHIDHVLAGTEPDRWRPAPGYSWTTNSTVVWVPERRELGFPHVTSGREPGTWLLDPGYSWHESFSSVNPHAAWRAGLKYPLTYPHITSGAQEDTWTFDPGYAWASDATSSNPKTVWVPGLEHKDHLYVVASTTEGRWLPASGFMFVDLNNPNDWRVMRPDRTYNLWEAMRRIDQNLDPRRCSKPPSASVILDAIRAARDEYRSLNLDYAHPELRRHVEACAAHFGEVYSKGAPCVALEDARESGFSLPDVTIAAACMFADDYQKCWEDTKALRIVGDTGERLICANLVKDAKPHLDELTDKRFKLRIELMTQYGLELPPATEPLLCP